MESVLGKTWAGDDSSRDGTSEVSGIDWRKYWAFGTSRSGLGLTTAQFWGYTPGQTDALVQEWRKDREYHVAVYAEIHATLRNVALGRGFKPPSGECWTADMFKPDYRAPKPFDDWRMQQAMLKHSLAPKKPPTPFERAQKKQAMEERRYRTKRAQEMAQQGAPRDQILLVMEGRL